MEKIFRNKKFRLNSSNELFNWTNFIVHLCHTKFQIQISTQYCAKSKFDSIVNTFDIQSQTFVNLIQYLCLHSSFNFNRSREYQPSKMSRLLWKTLKIGTKSSQALAISPLLRITDGTLLFSLTPLNHNLKIYQNTRNWFIFFFIVFEFLCV